MVEKKTASKKVEGLDLLSVRTLEKATEGVEMEILHPSTRLGTDSYVTVLGEDSDAHKRALTLVAERKEKEQRRTGRIRITHEDIIYGMLITAIECIPNWRNIVENGKEVPYNRANLRRILTEYWFITEQVNAFLADRANFMPD